MGHEIIIHGRKDSIHEGIKRDEVIVSRLILLEYHLALQLT